MPGKRPRKLTDAEVIELRRQHGIPDEGPPPDPRTGPNKNRKKIEEDEDDE